MENMKVRLVLEVTLGVPQSGIPQGPETLKIEETLRSSLSACEGVVRVDINGNGDAGSSLELRHEKLRAAVKRVLDEMGGDTPDWVQPAMANLEDVLIEG